MATEAAALAAEAALPDDQKNLRQCLNWMGFTALQRQRITAESFLSLIDVLDHTEKDICQLEESFAKGTPQPSGSSLGKDVLSL